MFKVMGKKILYDKLKFYTNKMSSSGSTFSVSFHLYMYGFKSCKSTVQSLYNMPHYDTDLDITLSCCGSQIFYRNHVILQRIYRKRTIKQRFFYLRILHCLLIIFLWDAKSLFQRVPGCNGIANLSCKKCSGLISLQLDPLIWETASPRTHRP